MAVGKAVKRDRNRQLKAGIKKHFGKTKSLLLKGVQVPVATIVSGLSKSISAGVDTDAKRVLYLEAAKTSRKADAAIDPIVVTLVDFLQSTMSAKALGDFNLQPKTRATPDVATLAAANAKRAATRTARNTMGKKERLKITGTTPATTVTAKTSASPASPTTPSNGGNGSST
jgi:hypothetical protein